MLGALLTFFIVGVIALAALTVILSVVGAIFGVAVGLAGFLLLKVLPIVLLGYVLVRFLAPRRDRADEAERKWLEEG